LLWLIPLDGHDPLFLQVDSLSFHLVQKSPVRSVAEKAISDDPDYPINYYNMACMDAELGNAIGAKMHLKQAFDRRANVLKGESMPDPTKDDSILKLKKDEAFWAFVLTLTTD
jgi:hypothetical protein